jgi:hypothetical protein
MLKLPPPLDIASLKKARTAPPSGYEVFEDVLYDVVNYPQAGVAAGGTLDFFATPASTADETLTNLKQAGQLPGSHLFHVKRVFITPLVAVSINGAGLTTVGVADDLDKIFLTSRSYLTFTSSVTNKRRGPIPLDMIGAIGGTVAQFGGTNGPAAGASAVLQQAKPHAHGGYPLDFIIGTAETFGLSIKFGAQVAISAATPLRVTLFGWRYLKVG